MKKYPRNLIMWVSSSCTTFWQSFWLYSAEKHLSYKWPAHVPSARPLPTQGLTVILGIVHLYIPSFFSLLGLPDTLLWFMSAHEEDTIYNPQEKKKMKKDCNCIHIPDTPQGNRCTDGSASVSNSSQTMTLMLCHGSDLLFLYKREVYGNIFIFNCTF